MKALSIRQPWAWLIVNGYKPVENRQWWAHYRGPLLIHAAKGMTKFEYEDCAELVASIAKFYGLSIPLPSHDKLERGGVVGRVDLIACVSDFESLWFSGKFGFVLENPTSLPFFPTKGQLGFFEIPEYQARSA